MHRLTVPIFVVFYFIKFLPYIYRKKMVIQIHTDFIVVNNMLTTVIPAI